LPRKLLNLGILAHVDAGKTTLTERLLYAAGVIDEVGSVDAGTTQTDSLALERQRGITIRAAVASFDVDDVTVNVIDTPGHPDFIAEVERALCVLDGAVLVVSAVEGVQPQTRVLMRALRRLSVPTVLFVNKIDRGGADPDRVFAAIAGRLAGSAVAMGTVSGAGERTAAFSAAGPGDATFRLALVDALAGQDESLLTAYVQDESAVTYPRLRAELAAQTRRAALHPVYFGSAITGAGIDALVAGLVELLPLATGDPQGPIGGRVFKVERAAAGDKVAYIRLHSGAVHVRDRLGGPGDKVTAISVFEAGRWVRRGKVSAGEIGKLSGLSRIQVGDAIGSAPSTVAHQFAPPTLESVVIPNRPADAHALRTALVQLAEQDPLINVRPDAVSGEVSVSLYGEVQKEVIQATLAADFGLGVTFRETTTICIERPAGPGEAIEILHAASNPYLATIGLRIEPAPAGSGITFRRRVDARVVPLYIYKNLENFTTAMAGYVRDALQVGRYGWSVTDCVVTLQACTYSVPDGPPSRSGPLSTAADFRKLTPLVVRKALEDGGTVVCEPVVRATLEVPASSVGPVLSALGRLAAADQAQSARGGLAVIQATLPAARLPALQRRLPGLTGGEGVLESRVTGYRPITGAPVRRLAPR
jgi:ribosomal protection tetracycline resistance protein